jgi:hypothetical protein
MVLGLKFGELLFRRALQDPVAANRVLGSPGAL